MDNTPNQPSKFNTKNLVEIIDESQGMYNKDNQIRFKTLMFSSSLCDYSDEYIYIYIYIYKYIYIYIYIYVSVNGTMTLHKKLLLQQIKLLKR